MATKRLDIIVNQKGAKKAQKEMTMLGKAVRVAAGYFSIQLAVSLGRSAIDMSKLAGSAEGVQNAFMKLNRPGLLKQFREATRNTASDFELMKAAVRAENFQIPLEKMGTLLEFAQKRARATGEDVNYLVDSMVMGIGRKSTMVLDNLGISASRLRKEFKGVSIEASSVGEVTSAVFKIANEEMKKAGEVAITTADNWEQIAASWENIKTNIGGVANQSGAIEALAGYMAWVAEVWGSFVNEKEPLDARTAALNRFKEIMKALSEEQQKMVMSNAKNLSGRMKLAVQFQQENKLVREQIINYENWREKQLQKIETDKQEAEWTRILNQELLKQEFGIRKISEANANRIESQEEVIGQIALITEASRDMSESYINEVAEGIISRNQAIAMSFANNLGGALSDALVRGTNTLKALERAFKATLARMAAEMAARAAIFSIFSLFGGGGLLGGSFSNFVFGGGRASGGPVNSGKAYVVGEEGPELFVPRTSGNIVPNNQIANNYTINLNGPVMGNARDIARQLQPELQRLEMGRA